MTHFDPNEVPSDNVGLGVLALIVAAIIFILVWR